jgi:hypothetical protein
MFLDCFLFDQNCFGAGQTTDKKIRFFPEIARISISILKSVIAKTCPFKY